MNLRRKEFTTTKDLNVYIGTWNVNAKKPWEDDITEWIQTKTKICPDIYCVGFQEIVDLNAGNLLVDHNASQAWEERIQDQLGKAYIKVSSKHLVGLSLCVYVTKELFPHLRDLQFHTVGVGIMGVGGNKGAVAIRFQLHDSTICFVNSHLAAHKGNIAGRNSDYHNICKRLQFTDKTNPQKPRMFGIFEHTFCFWLGDLNYRLNFDMAQMNMVFQHIDIEDYDYLLEQDQLLSEKTKKTVFEGWEEGKITFAPTYKYQPGSPLYERRPDKKTRMPAWCDRIQWRGEGVKQLEYRRAECQCSDHKPVCALHTVPFQMVVQEKREEVHSVISRSVDQWENQQKPKVTLSDSQISFVNTAMDTPVSQTFFIENSGQVLVQFSLVPRLEGEPLCKPFVSVSPHHGMILPGDKLEMTITVLVNKKSALALVTEEDRIEDIIIFRLENGGDHFVTISGNYIKSSFGTTLSYLVNTPTPVRFVGKLSTNTDTSATKRTLRMPKEIWRLVDWTYKHGGLEVPGLYITPCDESEMAKIKECLDTGEDFSEDWSHHAYCNVLVSFLDNLREPVFPTSLLEQFSEGVDLTAWCKQALMQLPPCHYNTFIFIVSFLREVLSHSEKNKLSPVQLVLVFSKCLMQSEPHYGTESKPKAWVILHHFITSDEFE